MAYTTIDKILNTIAIREGEGGVAKLPILETYIDTVWNELQLGLIKTAVYRKLYIDKKTNSVNIPNECIQLLALGYYDECNTIKTIDYNRRVPEQLVFSNFRENSCSCNCDNAIYKDVTELQSRLEEDVQTPNGVFKKIQLVYYEVGGNIVEENEYPIYDVDTNTTKIEKTKKTLCQLPTKQCGCPKETKENEKSIQKVLGCCQQVEKCGCSSCGDQEGYKISYTDSNKIILGANYPYDYVVLKMFVNATNKEDYKIPVLLQEAFIQGIRYHSATNDDAMANTIGYKKQIYMSERRKAKLYMKPYILSSLFGALGIVEHKIKTS